MKRGVKEVVKGIKKGEKGFVLANSCCIVVESLLKPLVYRSILVLAGDITPLDIISHLPLLAEEASIPYVFVASKEELGHASATKRPTSCVMVCPDAKVKRKKGADDTKEDEEEFKSSYAKCFSEIKELVSGFYQFFLFTTQFDFWTSGRDACLLIYISLHLLLYISLSLTYFVNYLPIFMDCLLSCWI